MSIRVLTGLLCLLVSSAAWASPEKWRASYACEARGDVACALTSLESLPAADYVVQLRRGWLLYLAERYSEAAAAYQSAAALEPKAIEPRLGLMLPLMALRRFVEAEKVGQEVLILAPSEFTATSRLAYIHYVQGRFAQAVTWYRKALAAYPSNVEMRAGLGWSLLKQNKVKEARVELERVLSFAPDHASAKEGLAMLP